MRIAVIGAGLVGLGTALELQRLRPDLDIEIIEKESAAGAHQSTHNSGVLHAGLYYKPGSLKAKLAVDGIRRMVQFCAANNVRHEICGKIVVACGEDEIPRLKALLERGTQNGLRGLKWLSRDELKEIEPHAAGVAALHVPEEGIVDYEGVCKAMAGNFTRSGGRLSLNTRFLALAKDGGVWRLETTEGGRPADFLVNCAGLHCDRVAEACGEARSTRIVPFRGEYYKLKTTAQHLVKNLIYPVPDPVFPFLGVHFTRLINGGIEAGPNAVLAFAREGYTKWNFNARDLADAALFPGLWRFMRKHAGMAIDEVKRSFSKSRFCASLQRLVPEIQIPDLEPGGTGVRAQAMHPDGSLVQDFEIIERPGALHVLNAPSPAATASLAIGEYIAQRALGSLKF